MKKCNSCTKCCDGSLRGEAYGHDFYPGKPCFFLILNSGCTIYEKRPNPQCTEFFCLWITEEKIPEFLKPNKSDCLASIVNYGGVIQIHVIKTGKNFDIKYLEWYKEFARMNKKDLSWNIDGEIGWQGSDKLEKAVKKYFKINMEQ